MGMCDVMVLGHDSGIEITIGWECDMHNKMGENVSLTCTTIVRLSRLPVSTAKRSTPVLAITCYCVCSCQVKIHSYN